MNYIQRESKDANQEAKETTGTEKRDMLATRMKGEKSPSLEATSRILTKIGLGPNIPDESRKVNNTGDSFWLKVTFLSRLEIILLLFIFPLSLKYFKKLSICWRP